MIDSIRSAIEAAFKDRSGEVGHDTRQAFTEFKRELNEGRISAAERDITTAIGLHGTERTNKKQNSPPTRSLSTLRSGGTI